MLLMLQSITWSINTVVAFDKLQASEGVVDSE